MRRNKIKKIYIYIYSFISTSNELFAPKIDGHGPGLQSIPTQDPVVEYAATHALKTIQQRSNSLVLYQLKEIVHANAEV